MSSTIEEITSILGAQRIGTTSSTIDWILTDSRSLCFPEETLFFALKTKRNDGHKYIPDLYQKGVRNFVVNEIPEAASSYTDANFLIVPNPLKSLQRLASRHREQFQVPVIGITGSNGKTVVKEWLYQILSPDRTITRSPRSYNSQIGVPLSVWLMNEHTELGIFEAGISEMGEMEALRPIIQPTIGILTNIGGAHQENFSSVQDKCMEKLQLFKDCDVIVYNGDNELITSCVTKSLFTAREIAWSTKDSERPLFIEKILKDDTGTTIKYRYLGFFKEYRIPFIDDASIENSLNCLAVALYLMVPPETIAERMLHLEPIAMRLEVKEGKNGCTLINDSYNSDFASLDIALDFMMRRSEDKNRKRTLILSDMLESGQTSKLLYRQVADLVHNYTGVDPEKFATFIVNVVGKSDEASYIVQLLNESGKLLQEKTGVHSGVCRFNYVPAGNVKFRIIEDMNDNGRWDTGNLVERRQPERAEYYMDDKNIDTFAAKENWEVELTIDMNKVFAPVTMQSLAELLEKREALRLQKVLEERAKNPRRNTNSNTSNTTSTMGGGFNSGMNTMMNGLR